MAEHRFLSRRDPSAAARRLVDAIDPDDLTTAERIQLAAVLVRIAALDESRTANLARLMTHAVRGRLSDHPRRDVTILAAVLRRRSRVLPPPRTRDGEADNGGV